MDKEREIRFLYPPLIVGAYFIWGWLSDTKGWQELSAILAVFKNLGPAPGTITALFAGSSLVLVVGYLLGTTSYVVLRLAAKCRDWHTHEIPEGKDAHSDIWKACGTSSTSTPKPSEIQMATVWLDFKELKGGVHEWIVRRWNAFNLSFSILVGVVLCWFWRVCNVCSRDVSCWWWGIGLAGFLIYAINAAVARREAMQMLAFAAKKLNVSPKNTEQGNTSVGDGTVD